MAALSPLDALKARLPAACWSQDAGDLQAASLDNLRLSKPPEVVIRPRDEEDVSAVLTLANEYRVPVTARGAGSATTGAATPWQGGWVLDFAGWTHIHIDPVAMMAYAQPGATVAAIDAAAREHGLFYAPDPGSKKWATLGGTLACNAGGLRGAKYGVTRDYVYALEGCLPTGPFVRWGADVKKYAAGYNLRDLWIGSEGTLGIITGAVLKLLPAPAQTRTFLAKFADESAALDAVEAILTARLIPSILEFLDRQTVGCLRAEGAKLAPEVSAMLGATNAPDSAVLLIEMDGHPAQVAEESARLLELLATFTDVCHEAQDATQAEAFWAVRRLGSRSMFRLGNTKLNEDVVVPLRSYRALLAYTLKLKDETGLATPTFGHAADGNFHVHIMYDREDKDAAARAEAGVLALMEEVIALGGVISGEHGIGLAKSPFFHLQHGEAEINAMQAVKQALDPHGILNPGKIFDPVNVWSHPRADVRLPWDH